MRAACLAVITTPIPAARRAGKGPAGMPTPGLVPPWPFAIT
jgi:hypothetical protein